MTSTEPEPEPVVGAQADLVDALRRLALLRDRDVLTEEEYQQAKVRLAEEYQTDSSASSGSSAGEQPGLGAAELLPGEGPGTA
jgi:hypothetical protein